jgi:ribosomal protein L4
VLSRKVKDAEVVVIDAMSFREAKTKEASQLFRIFTEKNIFPHFRGGRKNDLLVVLPAADQAALRAIRNIPYTKVVQADSLNVVDALSYRYLFMPKSALEVVEKTFAGKNTK